jgi:hypothetical protein
MSGPHFRPLKSFIAPGPLVVLLRLFCFWLKVKGPVVRPLRRSRDRVVGQFV